MTCCFRQVKRAFEGVGIEVTPDSKKEINRIISSLAQPRDLVVIRATLRLLPKISSIDGVGEVDRTKEGSPAVVRSVLLRNGIVLAGPAPAELIDPIPVSLLRQEILETMHTWGRQVLADTEQINNRFYQGFAVFHYCRSLHSIHTGVVGSKRAGAEWAKQVLDPCWAGLIDRAWDTRPNPSI